MKKFAALALVASAISAPAMAQDDVRPNFSGPYVAALVGYDRAKVGVEGLGSDHDSAVTYGGVVGYDINLGGAVFGVEAEYSDSNAKKSATDLLVAGDYASIRAGRDLYAGVRVGGEITSNVMLYAKGGYTNAKVEGVYDDGVDVFRASEKLDGYRLGAGLETTYAGFTGRLEYRYSRYNEFRDSGVNIDRNQVALLVGYRF